MGDERAAGPRSEGCGLVLDRRHLLGVLAAAGVAGCGSGGSDGTPEWPSPSDSYYDGLVDTLRNDHGLPPGEFVYADNEADTFDTYTVGGDVAETSSLDVGDDVPFSQAVRVNVTEAPPNTWDVSMRADVPDRDVDQDDVLLGVAYLRGPEESETQPIAQYVSKDEDNQSTNMVRSQAQVTPGPEWTRYYFPIQFDYDSDEDTWWTELFLGFDQQTVDVGGLALLDFDTRASVDALPSGATGGDGGGDGDGQGTDSGGDDREWESGVDERIQEHRTADLSVEVRDGDGNAVADADVGVAMQEHEFGFGTAIAADELVDSPEDGDYPTTVTDLFNTAVMENQHKWRFWETNQDLADEATDWLVERGLTLRGHVCLWGAVESYAVPEDVVSAMGVEWEDGGVTDPELDPEQVETRTKEHVEAIIDHYGDRIDEWEVVNEVLHQPGLIRAVNGVRGDRNMDDGRPVESPILREWYDLARETAPEGVTLAMNDYNTLVGPYPAERSRYEQQLEYLVSDGDRLDSLGMQCHFSGNETLTSTEITETLDTYAEHGVRLRITEFDMSDSAWAEEDKADFFYEFLKTVFAHEAVDDFLVWGFWDGAHWEDDAPFYTQDWEEKPALDEYRDLVFDEWWTDESLTTDADGAAAVTGFKGEYEVTTTINGEVVTETVTLSDDGATVELAPA